MRRACTEVEWFEDYEVGDEFLGEPVEFTEEEIVDFARRYDPQPFHIDREAAKASHFGGQSHHWPQHRPDGQSLCQKSEPKGPGPFGYEQDCTV